MSPLIACSILGVIVLLFLFLMWWLGPSELFDIDTEMDIAEGKANNKPATKGDLDKHWAKMSPELEKIANNPPPPLPPKPVLFQPGDMLSFAAYIIIQHDRKKCKEPKEKHILEWLKKHATQALADNRYKNLYERFRLKEVENG